MSSHDGALSRHERMFSAVPPVRASPMDMASRQAYGHVLVVYFRFFNSVMLRPRSCLRRRRFMASYLANFVTY